MMWIGLAILFTFVGGLKGEGCRDMFMDECGVSDIPKTLPKNKEDFDHICEIGDVKTECALRIFTKCEDESEEERAVSKEMEKLFLGLKEMMVTVCDKDSKVYETFASNIECIANVIYGGENVCARSANQEKRESLATAYFEALNEGSVEKDSPDRCLDDVIQGACLAVSLSVGCGKELLDPVLDILVSVSNVVFENRCSPEILQELPMFTHALAAIEEEVSEVANEIKKRKK